MTDFLKNLQAEKPPKPKFQRPPSTQEVTRDDANKAAGGQQRMHGKKKQLNTRIPGAMFEDLMSRIQLHADNLNLSQNDIQMYALMRGIQALDEGEVPKMKKRQVRNALQL